MDNSLKRTILLFGLATALLAAGCSKGDQDATVESTTNNPTANKPTSTGPAGTTYSAPPGNATPGGYAVIPANPNDPHFKQDPKLSGGH